MDYFLTVFSNGRERKLLKIRGRPGRASQIVAYLGRNFEDFTDRAVGATKFSIHPPRPGSDAHLIHFRMTKPATDDDWLDMRHYTHALTRHNTFAHVFTGRTTKMSTDYNDVGLGGIKFPIPEEFDPEKMTLTLGVYVGNIGIPFEVQKDEAARLVRIDLEDLSVIVLYFLEPHHPSSEYSRNIPTATIMPELVEDPGEREVYVEIMRGCSPHFAVNQFVYHHFELMRDYWKRAVQIAELGEGLGEIAPETVQKMRVIAAHMTAVMDEEELKRIDEGKMGRYLRRPLDWANMELHGD